MIVEHATRRDMLHLRRSSWSHFGRIVQPVRSALDPRCDPLHRNHAAVALLDYVATSPDDLQSW